MRYESLKASDWEWSRPLGPAERTRIAECFDNRLRDGVSLEIIMGQVEDLAQEGRLIGSNLERPPRSRDRVRAASEMQALVEASEELLRHLATLGPLACGALGDGGEARAVERLAARARMVLGWLEERRKPGRKRDVFADHLEKRAAKIWQQATGRKPVPHNKDAEAGGAGGPYVRFLSEIFAMAGCSASPYARALDSARRSRRGENRSRNRSKSPN